jgi:hypothetical protein
MKGLAMFARLVLAWVFLAGGSAVRAECLSTPRLAAADVATFPAKLGPALSGPFQHLAWGMSEDQVRAALPEDLRAAATRDRTWVKLGSAEVSVRMEGVLEEIQLRYPDRKAALDALAAWGAPASPDPVHHFEFWASAAGGTRALLRPDHDAKGRVVIELVAFSPLADQLGGDVFTAGKQPLLGLARSRVCLLSFDRSEVPTLFHLPATERSSGYLGMTIDWKADHVASYLFQVDYTYDRASKGEVPYALERKFGKPTTWQHPRFSSVTCLQFGDQVYACDGDTMGPTRVSEWQIYVGRTPR